MVRGPTQTITANQVLQKCAFVHHAMSVFPMCRGRDVCVAREAVRSTHRVWHRARHMGVSSRPDQRRRRILSRILLRKSTYLIKNELSFNSAHFLPQHSAKAEYFTHNAAGVHQTALIFTSPKRLRPFILSSLPFPSACGIVRSLLILTSPKPLSILQRTSHCAGT